MILRMDGNSHTYRDDQGVKMDVSATELVKFFRRPFDQIKASEDYAKKHGQTPEYWRQVWEEEGKAGRTFGNALHKMKEDHVMGSTLVKFRNSVKFVRNHNFYNRLEDLDDGVYAELPMGLQSYRIAGKPDEAHIETLGSIRYVDINDHKTNKRIRTEGYRSGGSTPKKMLNPISHLDDCEAVHHALQISIYAYIMEMHGYTPRDLTFTHYLKQPLHTSAPKVYPVAYLRKEVKMMLDYYRKHLKQSICKTTTKTCKGK